MNTFLHSTRHPAPLPLLLLLLMVAACGSDSPTDSGDQGSVGALSFNLTGIPSGAFSASGACDAGASSCALARTGSSGFEVRAARDRGARGDVVIIELPAAATGSYSITQGDAEFDYFVNTNQSVTDFDNWCRLDTGSATVTSVTGQRIRGSFSGQGSCWDGGEDETLIPISITGGEFDVPIVD